MKRKLLITSSAYLEQKVTCNEHTLGQHLVNSDRKCNNDIQFKKKNLTLEKFRVFIV